MSRALATGIGIFRHPGPAPLVMRGKRNARREPARGVAVWGGVRGVRPARRRKPQSAGSGKRKGGGQRSELGCGKSKRRRAAAAAAARRKPSSGGRKPANLGMRRLPCSEFLLPVHVTSLSISLSFLSGPPQSPQSATSCCRVPSALLPNPN